MTRDTRGLVLKHDKSLQRAAQHCLTTVLYSVADLAVTVHSNAIGLTSSFDGSKAIAVQSDRQKVHGLGMQDGLKLAERFEYKRSHTLFLASDHDRIKMGIYYVDTSPDLSPEKYRFYFIGTPKTIIQRLLKRTNEFRKTVRLAPLEKFNHTRGAAHAG